MSLAEVLKLRHTSTTSKQSTFEGKDSRKSMNTQRPTVTIQLTQKQLNILISLLELLIKIPNNDAWGDLLRHLRSVRTNLRTP